VTSSRSATEQGPAPAVVPEEFATRLLAWHARHGRHDLPWQRERNAYRVWVSEIMLQQTQVATVISYFERFVARFPTVDALADAPEDEVLHLWTGLGYYARARNLHRTARIVRDEHGGEFPQDLEQIAALPGIGRSTAGAISAIALGERAAILDGNVKRVLARHFAIEGDPTQSATQRRLWELAESLTPAREFAAYTQAIMDLGATLCTRAKPACALCPVAAGCRARAEGRQAQFPVRKQRRPLPVRQRQLLVIRNGAGEFLLEKRPPSGIWGGLWSFPEAAPEEDAGLLCDRISGARPRREHTGTPIRHTFSHYHLDATPVYLTVDSEPAHVMEDSRLTWFRPGTRTLGLAAPVKRLIETLTDEQPFLTETAAP